MAQLAINPNTVLKGLVEPRPGSGTFVRRTLADDTSPRTILAGFSFWRIRPH